MPQSKNDKPAAKTPAKKSSAEEAPAAAKKDAKAPVRSVSSSVLSSVKAVEIKDPFLKRQKERLLQLRDTMLDSMSGVARDTLRARAEGSEASAFGMHQADAGSDAYDRDFALSLLSQEQDALYEIDEALKRIDQGTYGICELCNKPILHARLEAIPFARFTVDCQSQIEKQRKMNRSRQPVTSLFGLTDEEGGSSEGEEEETVSEPKE
jgi:RNA polymerase-binding transcription factor DksA